MALLIPFILLALFFLLRANPQRRRVQAQQAMLAALQPGAHVVTVAGVIGTIVGIEGDRAAIEVAPGVIIEFLVASIVRVLDDAGGFDPVDDASRHLLDDAGLLG